VWQRSVVYIDLVYAIADQLPREEDFNLKSQIRHAATSIALNIAEGSTGQSDAEQDRFLGYALRSLIETVACQQLIRRRSYTVDADKLNVLYAEAQVIAKMIQALEKR
jgi:four helix bundle protein